MTLQNIKVANDFFHDACDFTHRYELTINEWFSIKSKRVKCYIDLRMAYECILKAVIVYFEGANDRESSINLAESFGHDIRKLEDRAQKHYQKELDTKRYAESLSQLPVGLRYRLDTFDFIDEKEGGYYETIGSDLWLDGLNGCIKTIIEWLDSLLQSHSRIVSGSVSLEELMSVEYNKYRKERK